MEMEYWIINMIDKFLIQLPVWFLSEADSVVNEKASILCLFVVCKYTSNNCPFFILSCFLVDNNLFLCFLSSSAIITNDNKLFFFLGMQVNLCFQKIAADILGIKLTKAEIQNNTVSFVLPFYCWDSLYALTL